MDKKTNHSQAKGKQKVVEDNAKTQAPSPSAAKLSTDNFKKIAGFIYHGQLDKLRNMICSPNDPWTPDVLDEFTKKVSKDFALLPLDRNQKLPKGCGFTVKTQFNLIELLIASAYLHLNNPDSHDSYLKIMDFFKEVLGERLHWVSINLSCIKKIVQTHSSDIISAVVGKLEESPISQIEAKADSKEQVTLMLDSWNKLMQQDKTYFAKNSSDVYALSIGAALPTELDPLWEEVRHGNTGLNVEFTKVGIPFNQAGNSTDVREQFADYVYGTDHVRFFQENILNWQPLPENKKFNMIFLRNIEIDSANEEQFKNIKTIILDTIPSLAADNTRIHFSFTSSGAKEVFDNMVAEHPFYQKNQLDSLTALEGELVVSFTRNVQSKTQDKKSVLPQLDQKAYHLKS